ERLAGESARPSGTARTGNPSWGGHSAPPFMRSELRGEGEGDITSRRRDLRSHYASDYFTRWLRKARIFLEMFIQNNALMGAKASRIRQQIPVQPRLAPFVE